MLKFLPILVSLLWYCGAQVPSSHLMNYSLLGTVQAPHNTQAKHLVYVFQTFPFNPDWFLFMQSISKLIFSHWGSVSFWSMIFTTLSIPQIWAVSAISFSCWLVTLNESLSSHLVSTLKNKLGVFGLCIHLWMCRQKYGWYPLEPLAQCLDGIEMTLEVSKVHHSPYGVQESKNQLLWMSRTRGWARELACHLLYFGTLGSRK